MLPVEEYFQAEQIQALIFILSGLIIAAVSGAVYYYYRTRFTLGFFISVALFSIVQIIVGTSVYFRSPDDSTRVKDYFEADIDMISSEEIPRMEEVMKSFNLLIWIEGILMALAVLLIIIFRQRKLLLGVACGILLQATVSLILDVIAETRGDKYLQYLIQNTEYNESGSER